MPSERVSPNRGALEAEADEAAAGAVVALHGGERAAILRQPVLPRLKSGLQLRSCNGKKASAAGTLLTSFRKDFSASADLIDKSPAALKLVAEAETAGAKYGGFAEDGPGRKAWPYTSGDTVYVPRARTDPVVAMSDFLFELNNAIRKPTFAEINRDAASGSIDAKQFARRVVEQEVDGMLRLGEVWFETKKARGGTDWDKYDHEFYLSEYQDVREKRKTRDDIVNNVLLGCAITSRIRSGRLSSTTWISTRRSAAGADGGTRA